MYSESSQPNPSPYPLRLQSKQITHQDYHLNPIYYEANQPVYEYHPNPPENYDIRYSWNSLPEKSYLPPSFPQYEQTHILDRYPNKQSLSEPFSQVSIVERISAIIKSQLGTLQAATSVPKKRFQEERRRRERSRSRSKDRKRKGSHNEWSCHKCSFFNFDFRLRCDAHRQSAYAPGYPEGIFSSIIVGDGGNNKEAEDSTYEQHGLNDRHHAALILTDHEDLEFKYNRA
ncbi:unnamed protein product [Sphagnum balticum]